MSKIKKVFIDTENGSELEIYVTSRLTISICVDDYSGEHIIELDVPTAIAFSKELRKQINLAKEDGEG